MALKDTIAFGMSLPLRSGKAIPAAVVRQWRIGQTKLGFQDRWVTSNTVDTAGCFDALTVLERSEQQQRGAGGSEASVAQLISHNFGTRNVPVVKSMEKVPQLFANSS